MLRNTSKNTGIDVVNIVNNTATVNYIQAKTYLFNMQYLLTNICSSTGN